MKLFLVIATVWVGFSGQLRAADWIWPAGDRMAETKPIRMSRQFELSDLPSGTAELRALGDFCSFEVSLNGHLTLKGEPYAPLKKAQVKRWLRKGPNMIVIRAQGVEGPSAVALDLRFTATPDQEDVPILSTVDEWENAVSVSPLDSLRLDGSEMREITPLDEYNQWKEASGSDKSESKFSPLPEEFAIELVRKAEAEEGSWISMAFEPGTDRLIISKEKRGLLAFSFDERGSISKAETVEDTLLECRGLLFKNGSLFANANNTKAMVRVRDTTGNGAFDEVTPLIETGGSVGHGRNDLAIGPDGMIYSIHGDSVHLPKLLQQHRPSKFGFGSERGYVLRTDLEGKERDIWCIGLRNPYGIAFNKDGEAFTYDADNEGDIGLPLYRPTRVSHLLSGGNYGWWQEKEGQQSWPVYAPDGIDTTLDIGRGSPTAVEFGYKSNFPPEWRDALYILDWAYGRIIAVDLVARGASYLGYAKDFLRGRPLNVTDIAFGPDGAMYFITGGRKTQSALYRVKFTGTAFPAEGPTDQERERAAFSSNAREIRKRIEAYHGKADPKAGDDVWKYLDDPDPAIRNAARVALEHQPLEGWESRALSGTSLSALLGLARHPEFKRLDELIAAAQQFDMGDLPRSARLTIVRIHELALKTGPSPERIAKGTRFLAAVFPDPDKAVNRELSKILLQHRDEKAVRESVLLLNKAEKQEEKLHYLDALSKAQAGLTVASTFLETADYFRGDRNLPGYLKRIREHLGLGEGLSSEGKPVVKEKPDPPKPRPSVQNWNVSDFDKKPDFEPNQVEGRKIFEEALCSRCHQIKGFGNPVGPNLTAVASRFTRKDQIEAILKPSRAIAEVFKNVVFTKTDGSTLSGRLVSDDIRNSTVTIAPNPLVPEALIVIPKKEIKSHEFSPISPMPAGLLNGFTREEIWQLLAFLESGGT